MRLTREDDLIDWLRRRVPGGERLGDDAALLSASGPLAVSIDQQIAGTHFPDGLDPAWIARRLLEVCLSDLAACGARPRWALLALAAPADWGHRRFLRALAAACRRRGVELVGGDTAAAERVGLSLCVVGEPAGAPGFVSRAAARPGDRLWIGGWLGASRLGRHLVGRGAGPDGPRLRLPAPFRSSERLRRAARRAVRAHLAPRAQLELGAWLGARRRAAAIDVSDGLALDLARLCRASGVGAVIDPAALPVDPAVRTLAHRCGLEPLDAALSGGEDYVLLFALPPSVTPPAAPGRRPIGRCSGDGRLLLIDGSELAPAGWSHLG
jgi:thiamine-monophosphate kinase